MALHTDKHFEAELQELKEGILKMGGIVEEMMMLAMKSLLDRDTSLAESVIQKDRPVNKLEMEIDELCLKLLALNQPAASDLRFITIGLKITKDLERMGDLAVNICQAVIELNRDAPLKPYIDLPRLAEQSQKMVKDALDSFVRRDAVQAAQVCQRDDDVDALKDKIINELVALMKSNSDSISRSVRLISIARHLERIADHATNIAELVIFMVQGKDIRHGGLS